MQLTPHFSLEEYANSSIALRMGIDNTPPAVLIPNLRRNAITMEMVRAALSREAGRDVPILMDSGYRCEALEKVVARNDFISWCKRHDMDEDAHAWSVYFPRKKHPEGNAADWTAPSFGTPAEIVSFISGRPELMHMIDQIICEGTWVHTGTSDSPRGIVMTAKFDAAGIPTYERV